MTYFYYDGNYTIKADTLKELRHIFWLRGPKSAEVYRVYKNGEVETVGVLRYIKGKAVTYTNYHGMKYWVNHDGSLTHERRE